MEPITYGLRKKGETAIIGVIPAKIHERPATSAEFTENYEEIPLYDQATVDELRRDAERYRWLRDDAFQATAARIVQMLPGHMDAEIDAAMQGANACVKLWRAVAPRCGRRYHKSRRHEATSA